MNQILPPDCVSLEFPELAPGERKDISVIWKCTCKVKTLGRATWSGSCMPFGLAGAQGRGNGPWSNPSDLRQEYRAAPATEQGLTGASLHHDYH